MYNLGEIVLKNNLLKIICSLIIAALFFITAAYAGQPQGAAPNGSPPTTMIGPLNATKMTLADVTGGYSFMSIFALNASAAVAYIEFFDRDCATVTLGITSPSWVQPVAAFNSSYISWPQPLAFYSPDAGPTPALCVVSVTSPNGTVGSANGVYMQTFGQ